METKKQTSKVEAWVLGIAAAYIVGRLAVSLIFNC